MDLNKNDNSTVKTWIWIGVMLLIILGTGIFAFVVVSDKGQPGWDYRAVQDVPAQSPNAEYEKLPHTQHIKGKKGE